MQRDLVLSPAPLDPAALVAAAPRSATAGARVHFFGVVRGSEGGMPVDGLDYEAFEAMARHQFSRLFDELEQRWPSVELVRLVHRTGPVRAGDASLFVEVAAAHRAEAFAACQWLIDEMKRVVPIWKRALPAGAQR